MKPHELRIMSHADLKALLSSVVVVKNKYPECATIHPYSFCPRCGCRKARWTGNMAYYPDRWDRAYCARCGLMVAESDNSPYYHCLEFPEENYWIDD